MKHLKYWYKYTKKNSLKNLSAILYIANNYFLFLCYIISMYIVTITCISIFFDLKYNFLCLSLLLR